MAQYTITHTCTHSATVDLVGKTDERTRKIAWLKTQPCMTCKRTATATADAQAVQADTLPALTGSAKQVEWAQRIRIEGLKAVDQFVADTRVRAEKAGQVAAFEAQIAPMIAKVRAQTSASWWIDNRGLNGQSLLRLVRN